LGQKLEEENSGDDELDEEEVEEKSSKGKGKKAGPLSPAEKKRKLIIQGFIAVVVLYFAADMVMEHLDKAEPEIDPATTLKPRPRPEATGEGAPVTADTPPTIEDTPAVEETPAIEDTPSIDEPVIADTPGVDEPTFDEPTFDGSTIDETPMVTEEPTVSPPVTQTPTQIPSEEPVQIADLPEGPTADVSDDIVDDQYTTPQDDDLTDRILQDLEKKARPQAPKVIQTYVAPPDYEFRGRGLVYNCAGKHWACVDGPSYKSCEDNMASVNFLKRKIECYPFNVYETVRGCESMQNRMVSSSAKTNFCSEN
jgi:hypothetical protein